MVNLAKCFLGALAALVVLVVSPARADGYGACDDTVAKKTDAIITALQPVEGVTKVSEEITVVLVDGKVFSDGTDLGDSVVAISKYYSPDIHAALSNEEYESAWIGIREGVDGAGDPALWMHLFVSTMDKCVDDLIFERVYWRRNNAPNIFWEAVEDWERNHPDSALIPATKLREAENAWREVNNICLEILLLETLE